MSFILWTARVNFTTMILSRAKMDACLPGEQWKHSSPSEINRWADLAKGRYIKALNDWVRNIAQSAAGAVEKQRKVSIKRKLLWSVWRCSVFHMSWSDLPPKACAQLNTAHIWRPQKHPEPRLDVFSTVEQRIMGKISVSGWYLAILSPRAWRARMLALSSPGQLEQKD